MATSSPSARLFNGVLPSMIVQRLEEWISKSHSVSILVTGAPGTGKSSLVNGIIGHPVALVRDDSDESDDSEAQGEPGNEGAGLQYYEKKIGNIQVNVWDSPGLQNTDLDCIKKNCRGSIDLFLYCIDMSDTRFLPENDDITAMKHLTGALGMEVWKNTLFVLTFANHYILQVKDEFDNAEDLRKDFTDQVKSWKSKIHSTLEKDVGLDPLIVKSIKVLPAGDSNTPQLLPDDNYWLSELWEKAVYTARPLAQPALVKLNEHRLTSETTSVCTDNFIHEQPLILAKIGKCIGEELGVGEMGYEIGRQYSDTLVACKFVHGVLYHLDKLNEYFSEIPDRTPID